MLPVIAISQSCGNFKLQLNTKGIKFIKTIIMNDVTLYDETAKEYLNAGKVGDGFFTSEASHDQIINFLSRVRFGNKITIFLDSKGHPEKFYDDEEYEKWKEIT